MKLLNVINSRNDQVGKACLETLSFKKSTSETEKWQENQFIEYRSKIDPAP